MHEIKSNFLTADNQCILLTLNVSATTISVTDDVKASALAYFSVYISSILSFQVT